MMMLMVMMMVMVMVMVMSVFVFVLLSYPVCTAAPPCHNGDGGDDGDCDDHHDKDYYDYSNAYFKPVSLDKIFVDIVNETTAWLSTVHHTSQTESEKNVFLVRTPKARSQGGPKGHRLEVGAP